MSQEYREYITMGILVSGTTDKGGMFPCFGEIQHPFTSGHFSGIGREFFCYTKKKKMVWSLTLGSSVISYQFVMSIVVPLSPYFCIQNVNFPTQLNGIKGNVFILIFT